MKNIQHCIFSQVTICCENISINDFLLFKQYHLSQPKAINIFYFIV